MKRKEWVAGRWSVFAKPRQTGTRGIKIAFAVFVHGVNARSLPHVLCGVGFQPVELRRQTGSPPQVSSILECGHFCPGLATSHLGPRTRQSC